MSEIDDLTQRYAAQFIVGQMDEYGGQIPITSGTRVYLAADVDALICDIEQQLKQVTAALDRQSERIKDLLDSETLLRQQLAQARQTVLMEIGCLFLETSKRITDPEFKESWLILTQGFLECAKYKNEAIP